MKQMINSIPKADVLTSAPTLANTMLVAATSVIPDESKSQQKQVKRLSTPAKCPKKIEYSQSEIENLIINDLAKKGFVPTSEMTVLFRTFRAFKYRIESAHLTRAIINVVPLHNSP